MTGPEDIHRNPGAGRPLAPTSGREEPAWDADLAESLIGKTVLIGVNYVTKSGRLLEQAQYWGEIAEADQGRGIRVRLAGVWAGRDSGWPPDLRPFWHAKPGTYVLRSTKEHVINPDFLAEWTITPKDAPD